MWPSSSLARATMQLQLPQKFHLPRDRIAIQHRSQVPCQVFSDSSPGEWDPEPRRGPTHRTVAERPDPLRCLLRLHLELPTLPWWIAAAMAFTSLPGLTIRPLDIIRCHKVSMLKPPALHMCCMCRQMGKQWTRSLQFNRQSTSVLWMALFQAPQGKIFGFQKAL